MKGANALRVEERIARVPLDVIRSAEGDTGVFEALKDLEREARSAGREPPRVESRAKPEASRSKTAPRAPAVRSPESGSEAARRLGPDSFTKAERRAIVVSCTEYRNRLPTYLQSAKGEVEIIDSILRKCGSAEAGPLRAKGGDRGKP